MINDEKDVNTSSFKIKRRCIIWQTENYDDERFLKHFRAANSQKKMSIIIKFMNKFLSIFRQRSVNSVSFKWKHLKVNQLKNRNFTSLNAELDEVFLSQFDDYVNTIIFAIRKKKRNNYSYLSNQLIEMWHQLSRTINQRESHFITNRSNVLNE